ncbi:hypothetical protein [Anatilimnocola floriformis]|uniref:hypothetical protein n=1 Tax=Anatilimnocola floriformis TaxID=2948575 RepID=UPI0020C4595B|nr:hypothetical protein [Anatilimnocola floriformis]
MTSRLLLTLLTLGSAWSLTAAAQRPEKVAAKPEVKESVKKDSPKEPVKETPNPKEQPKAKLIPITPEREAAVMEFVEKNHAELAALLTHLKTSQPKEYERAVRDLFRVTEKLAMVKDREDGQYNLELKAWKAQSRAQLLVARLKMTDPESANTEEMKSQLREILSEQLAARIEVMKLERERTTARLDRLNQDIGKFEQDREKVIDGHVQTLMNQVNANRPKNKPLEKKPAERAPSDKAPADKKPKPTS